MPRADVDDLVQDVFVIAMQRLGTLRDPESFGGIAFLSYLSTVLTVGLLTAGAGVSLFHVCTELGATRTAALFAALSFGLATPIWALATLFIGHALSAACLVFAFTAALRIGRADESADRRLGAIVGLGAGWATVSEFPAVVPAALLAGLAVVHEGETRPVRRDCELRGRHPQPCPDGGRADPT